MKRALIYLDPDAIEDSINLTEAVEGMYGPDKIELSALVLAPDSVIDDETMTAFDRVFQIDSQLMGRYDIESIAEAMAELHETGRFDAILILATTFGRMLAPTVAMRLNLGLTADVTEIRRDGDTPLLVRPAFSGRMLAAIANRGPGPIMASIRPNTFVRRNKTARTGMLESFVPFRLTKPRVRLIKSRAKPNCADIRDSEVLISGGGGAMLHFEKLEALAQALGGMVSASRRAVDGGKAPRQIQVGQSGKMVSPKLYIAVGISGSVQHVVGLKNAEYIIAVNTNPHAPICSIADIVVEGDAREFLDKILERIRQNGPVSPV